MHFNSRLEFWLVCCCVDQLVLLFCLWASFFFSMWHAAFHWLTCDLCGLQIFLQIRLMRLQLSLHASLLIHKEFKTQSVTVLMVTRHHSGFHAEYQYSTVCACWTCVLCNKHGNRPWGGALVTHEMQLKKCMVLLRCGPRVLFSSARKTISLLTCNWIHMFSQMVYCV